MDKVNDIIAVARRYCSTKDITLDQVSYQVTRDRRRFSNVEARHASMTLKSYEHAMKWFDANWPQNTEWPNGVERPGRRAASTTPNQEARV